MPMAVAVNCAWNFSKEPKESLMASASSPSGWPPPLGERFFQKMEWLVWPPRLKARFFSHRLMAARSPASRAAARASRAALAPAT